MALLVSFQGNLAFLRDELIRLEEGDRNHRLVKQVFLTGMGDLQDCTTVEARYGIPHSSLLGKARVQPVQSKKNFLLEWEIFGDRTTVEARNGNPHSSLLGKARCKLFRII